METHTRYNLRDAVAATLTYFDLFDYPLTLQELRRYLYRYPHEGDIAPTTTDLLRTLEDPAFGSMSGFYFLVGRSGIVAVRQKRFRMAERKYRRALAFARVTRFLPSVRLISVCNSLAISNAGDKSDIDMFLVVRPGTVWATRLLVAGTLSLLRLRPTKTRHADMFCISFYVSETNMNLASVALPDGDMYLRYWIASLIPIYDTGDMMRTLVEANRDLLSDIPAVRGEQIPTARMVPLAPRWMSFLLPFLRLIEPLARWFQMRKFPESIRAKANRDSRVRISDDMLKFHVNDRRSYFEEEFSKRFVRQKGKERV
ncbi:hypothetical protein ACFLZO_00170 [Patescibacteria group bacterium]